MAATLGLGRWAIFWRVTLPLAGRSLLSGAVMTWARALGEFGATIMFAGNFQGRTQTMPLAIYIGLQDDLDGALARRPSCWLSLSACWRWCGCFPAGGCRMLELDFTYRLIEFTIQAGITAPQGVTVLFGPSGAGKSLTLQCVAGLVRPDAGRIVVAAVLFDSELGIDVRPRRDGWVTCRRTMRSFRT